MEATLKIDMVLGMGARQEYMITFLKEGR